MYLKILLHALVAGFVGLFVGGAFGGAFARGPEASIFAFLGGCTGVILGGILGATRCILLDLPDAIERAMFVRKIRDIDDFDERESRG